MNVHHPNGSGRSATSSSKRAFLLPSGPRVAAISWRLAGSLSPQARRRAGRNWTGWRKKNWRRRDKKPPSFSCRRIRHEVSQQAADRKRVGKGKSEAERVELGGRRVIKK